MKERIYIALSTEKDKQINIMGYNKNDESGKYNKSERGGWYCTNPKKHDDGNQHHGANEQHEHRAERNDREPERHDSGPSRYERDTRQKKQPADDGKWRPFASTTPPRRQQSNEPPVTETPAPETPAKKNNGSKGCGCLIWIFMTIGFFKWCNDTLNEESTTSDQEPQTTQQEANTTYDLDEYTNDETTSLEATETLSDSMLAYLLLPPTDESEGIFWGDTLATLLKRGTLWQSEEEPGYQLRDNTFGGVQFSKAKVYHDDERLYSLLYMVNTGKEESTRRINQQLLDYFNEYCGECDSIVTTDGMREYHGTQYPMKRTANYYSDEYVSYYYELSTSVPGNLATVIVFNKEHMNQTPRNAEY